MNESYDAITVRPMDSSIGVNISVEKAFAAYENGTPIPEIAEHFADAVEKGFRESPHVDLESLSDYEQMKSKGVRHLFRLKRACKTEANLKYVFTYQEI